MKNIAENKKKPIILIIPDYKSGGGSQYSTMPHYAIRCNYFNKNLTCNTIPLVAPYNYEAIEEYLQIASGIIFVGGGFDLDPKRYNQEPHSTIKLNKERDDFEYCLITKALLTAIPILGICNGMQLINVACGGSLIQNITDFSQYLDHEQAHSAEQKLQNYHNGYHEINIVKTSKMANFTNMQRAKVNSSHHQAVELIGKNLQISAIASDGIVEAIESTTNRFLIGIQWHPEFESSNIDHKIFQWFISEANNYMKI